MTARIQNSSVQPLNVELQNRLRDLVTALGLDNVAASVGVSREVVTRAMAGVRIQIGTRTMIEAFLKSVEGVETEPKPDIKIVPTTVTTLPNGQKMQQYKVVKT